MRLHKGWCYAYIMKRHSVTNGLYPTCDIMSKSRQIDNNENIVGDDSSQPLPVDDVSVHCICSYFIYFYMFHILLWKHFLSFSRKQKSLIFNFAILSQIDCIGSLLTFLDHSTNQDASLCVWTIKLQNSLCHYIFYYSSARTSHAKPCEDPSPKQGSCPSKIFCRKKTWFRLENHTHNLLHRKYLQNNSPEFWYHDLE